MGMQLVSLESYFQAASKDEDPYRCGCMAEPCIRDPYRAEHNVMILTQDCNAIAAGCSNGPHTCTGKSAFSSGRIGLMQKITGNS